jgi:hypothetical protein
MFRMIEVNADVESVKKLEEVNQVLQMVDWLTANPHSAKPESSRHVKMRL